MVKLQGSTSSCWSPWLFELLSSPPLDSQNKKRRSEVIIAQCSGKEKIVKSVPEIQVQAPEDFSLKKVAHLLESYTPPPVAGFVPAGKWRQEYTMFLLQPDAGVKKGEFSLARSANTAQNLALTVRTRRTGNSGFSQFQHAEMQCRVDTLSAPVSWIFDTKMARDAQDPPYLNTVESSLSMEP